MHSKIVLITGVPGVGVSAIARELEKRNKVGFTYLNFGSIMLEQGSSKHYVKDRDRLRELPIRKQKELQLLTAVNIQEKSRKLLLVDTHCTVRTPEGYFPGFPRTVLEQLDPEAIVIVEADPKEIMTRRALDVGRKRDTAPPEKIAEQQAMNRAAAMSYATFVGAPVLIVENHQERIDEAAEAIEKILISVDNGQWG